MTIGFDFSSAAQLKAVLMRVEDGGAQDFKNYDALKCLWDHSCVESEMIGKNEIGIAAILTNGNYELIIFDQEENSVRKWLHQDVGLTKVPFTFEL